MNETGTIGKLLAVAVVGALGVGVSATAAHAEATPAPAPPSIDLADVDKSDVTPLAFPWRTTSSRPQARTLAADARVASLPDDFDGDGRSDMFVRDLGGRYVLSSSYGAKVTNRAAADHDILVLPGNVTGGPGKDILARTPAGSLYVYSDVKADAPKLSGRVIGSGWQIYNRVLGAGDLTGDGNPDILARDTVGDLYLYKGAPKTAALFSPRVKIGGGLAGYDQLTISPDLTGDGVPDLLARDTKGDLYRYNGRSNGTFTGRVKIGNGWQVYNQIVAGGDYDGNGLMDVTARATNGDMWVYSSLGNGTLSARAFATRGGQAFDAIAGTGAAPPPRKSGLVARAANGDLYFYNSDNKGGLNTRQLIANGLPKAYPLFHSVSTNPSGISDVMIANHAKTLVSLDTGQNLAPGWGDKTMTVGPGDLTGDGKADILARNPAGSLLLYRNNWPSALAKPVNLGGGWNIYDSIVGAGDLSGDGIADVVARTTSGDLYLYKGRRDGKLSPRVRIGTGWSTYNQLAAPGDLTGDGVADILGRDRAGKLWLHAGKSGNALAGRVRIGTGWGIYTTFV